MELMALIYDPVSSVVEEQNQQRTGKKVRTRKRLREEVDSEVYKDIKIASSFFLKNSENIQFKK